MNLFNKLTSLLIPALMLLLTGCGLGICAEFEDCSVVDVPATALFLTLNVSHPDVLNTRVAFAGGSGAITWSSSHSADATVRFFRHTAKVGGCSSKTFIDSVSEPAGGTGGTYNWDTTGMPVGTYYICVQLTDGVETVDGWAEGAIQVNGTPTFAFVQPMGSDDYVKAGNTFNVSWTATDSDSDATISIYLKTINTGACNVGTLIASSINETSTTDWNFTATNSHDSNEYYLCAVIDDGVNAPSEYHSAMLTNYRDCVWTGGTTAFATAGNWTTCNSVAPTFVDRIEVPAAAPNQPTLSASRTIAAFSEATGGGTITINAGVTLSLTYSPATIGSSIIVRPNTSACTTCDLKGAPSTRTTSIVNNATLTLQPGMTFRVGETDSSALRVGTTTSRGHLVVNGGGTPAEYPIIRNYNTVSWDMFAGIYVQGVDGSNRSSLTVSGMKMIRSNPSIGWIGMGSYAQLLQVDNVQFETSTVVDGNSLGYGSFIYFQNCTGSTSAASFSGLQFNAYSQFGDAVPGFSASWPYGMALRADGTNCTAGNGFGVTVAGSGPTFGAGFEYDPNNIIAWTNGASFSCTWTGATNTAWNNSGNWSGCANGRGGYPDGNDTATIPSAPVNQPTVSGFQQVQSILGSGGTITVAAGATLQFRRGLTTFSGDINFRGATANCTTCNIRTWAGATIYNGATVTLLTGISWSTSWWNGLGYLRVGNGASSGHLATAAADPTPTNWPTLTASTGTSIHVNGAPGDRSSLDIEGLRFANLYYEYLWSTDGVSTYYAIRLQDHYNIDQFDKVTFDVLGTGAMEGRYIQIESCANSTYNDTTWTEIDFMDAIFIPVPLVVPPYTTPPKTGRNVVINGCSSLGVGGLDIYPYTSGVNLGFGATDETDPDGVLDWH